MGVFALVVALGAAFAQGTLARTDQKPKPRVWIVDRSPITVAASGFASRERVTLSVVASSGTRLQKTVRATRAGKVRAEWTGSVQVDACHVVIVRAVGSSGLRATYASPKGVDCNPVQPINQ
jgi:hypothetical protein